MSIANRLKEPSTYAGLAATITGIGQIVDFHAAPQVADAVVQVAPSIIAGNWFGAILTFLGLAAVFVKEKSSDK